MCKLADPRYPYFDWQVKNPMSTEQQVKLDLLLRVFHARLAGEEAGELVGNKAKQVLPHLSLNSGPPTFHEADAAIRDLLGWRSPEQVLELLEAMRAQGSLEDLSAHLLRDAVRPSPPRSP